ncbi:uncharacterized protein PRCAT00001322001 [Priceomyces carsonii]|uniref:uncharacterized protein n=1 Tax=Priceomyces carsonii TaxID=28549 RepID=UPI002ED7DFF2|nr:unnamed protein product [Priceomyces carsonii]
MVHNIKQFNLNNEYKAADADIQAVLTIAGSDCSGGAGIEADLKSFSAHDVYGLTCITALTAQNTQGVYAIQKTPQEFVHKILKANFEDFVKGYDNPPLKVVKTGLLTLDAIKALKDYLPLLENNLIKLVVDPVMISTSGSQLFDEGGMKLCINEIIGSSYLVTPNFEEAKALWRLTNKEDAAEPKIRSLDSYCEFVVSLQRRMGCKNILVKGGHIPWHRKRGSPVDDIGSVDQRDILIIDILYQSECEKVSVFESQYLPSKDNHGSGCTLASSIAANLANGKELKDSILISINFIHEAMQPFTRKLGHGNGPLNHLVKVETRISRVLDSNLTNKGPLIRKDNDSFLEFFKSNPKIKDNWKRYTSHRFVELLAKNMLPFESFMYFLKQDYYYLVNYIQCVGLASSVAPSNHNVYLDANICGSVAKELERHKAKLYKEYRIDYDKDAKFDIHLTPGQACLNYCNFLLDIARKEDYLGIKVALAPCLHGYFEAGQFGLCIRSKLKEDDMGVLHSKEESDIYTSWLDDYGSDWYRESYDSGKQALQELLESIPMNQERIEELVDIFNKVTTLEIAFWDEALSIKKPE